MELEPSSNETSVSVTDEFVNANTSEELNFLELGKVTAEELQPTTLPTTIATNTQAGKSGIDKFQAAKYKR